MYTCFLNDKGQSPQPHTNLSPILTHYLTLTYPTLLPFALPFLQAKGEMELSQLSDELDVARDKGLRLIKAEAQIEKYQQRLEEMIGLKKQNKELSDRMDQYLDQVTTTTTTTTPSHQYPFIYPLICSLIYSLVYTILPYPRIRYLPSPDPTLSVATAPVPTL